jgi:diguanylate cyclase (GGDEF)-like protein
MLTLATFTDALLIDTTALAAVALIGYIFGRRTRQQPAPQDAKLLDELARAQLIAAQLEHLASRVAAEAGAHRAGFAAFKSHIAKMQAGVAGADWPKLRSRADGLLSSTWRLATGLSLAGDQLRNQQAQLITFSGSRVDPATGVHNRRSMEEHLDALISMHSDGKRHFALALFSVASDVDESEAACETRLRLVARLLQECIRDNDFVARYSHDEFVVLMPQTTLAGAVAFGERLMRNAGAYLRCPVWGGIVEAASGETGQKLLSRADSALYSARAEGDSCLFQHTGVSVRRHVGDAKSSATGRNDQRHANHGDEAAFMDDDEELSPELVAATLD